MSAELKPEVRDALDARLQIFLKNIVQVAGYAPRSKYLYPIMSGVPFCDLEVALLMAKHDHDKTKANDR